MHADKVTTPTLMLHTRGDARVPVSQAREFHTALMRRGAKPQPQLIIYPGEGHGIGQLQFSCEALNHTLQWIDKHVMNRNSADQPCATSR
jgi:dipeptidyl aminopeptidase/acylaminoacyl peptidase